jgi:hypothetical protein
MYCGHSESTSEGRVCTLTGIAHGTNLVHTTVAVPGSGMVHSGEEETETGEPTNELLSAATLIVSAPSPSSPPPPLEKAKHKRKWRISSDVLSQESMSIVRKALALQQNPADRIENKRVAMRCLRLWRIVTGTSYYHEHGVRIYTFEKHCYVVLGYMREAGLKRAKDQIEVVQPDPLVASRMSAMATKTNITGTLTAARTVFRSAIESVDLHVFSRYVFSLARQKEERRGGRKQHATFCGTESE